jgi:hypothetical protein
VIPASRRSGQTSNTLYRWVRVLTCRFRQKRARLLHERAKRLLDLVGAGDALAEAVQANQVCIVI